MLLIPYLEKSKPKAILPLPLLQNTLISSNISSYSLSNVLMYSEVHHFIRKSMTGPIVR